MNSIAELQRQLQRRASPKTKRWWESYLKQAIPFRGVRMADIRAVLHSWLENEPARAGLSGEGQLELALGLIRERYAEDKLAGILYLQEVLIPAGTVQWRRHISRFAELFRDGHITDWNTCDWFCVKVLGPLAERGGEPCARVIAEWRTAESLWQRRASGVAFINLAKSGDENFAGLTDLLLEICASTVRCPERFAQTGTAWVLRELSRAEPDRVTRFIEGTLAFFSSEGVRTATAKLPSETRTWLRDLRKAERRLAAGRHTKENRR